MCCCLRTCVSQGGREDDDGFARPAAALCDVYVNDAFGARTAPAHRRITKYGLKQRGPDAKRVDYRGGSHDQNIRSWYTGRCKSVDKITGLIASSIVSAKIDRGRWHTLSSRPKVSSVGTALVEDDIYRRRGIRQRAKEKGVELLLPTITRRDSKTDKGSS